MRPLKVIDGLAGLAAMACFVLAFALAVDRTGPLPAAFWFCCAGAVGGALIWWLRDQRLQDLEAKRERRRLQAQNGLEIIIGSDGPRPTTRLPRDDVEGTIAVMERQFRRHDFELPFQQPEPPDDPPPFDYRR